MIKVRGKFQKVNLLILDKRADEYKRALDPKFPEVRIHGATKEEEVGDFISKANFSAKRLDTPSYLMGVVER
jgi:hypothetical protein